METFVYRIFLAIIIEVFRADAEHNNEIIIKKYICILIVRTNVLHKKKKQFQKHLLISKLL